MTRRDVKAVRRRVREVLAGQESAFQAPRGEAIATGGTVRALARLLRERGRDEADETPPAQHVSRKDFAVSVVIHYIEITESSLVHGHDVPGSDASARLHQHLAGAGNRTP